MASEPTPPSGWASHEPRTLLQEVDYQRARADTARALADELAERLNEWHQAHDIGSGGVCPLDCPTADAFAKWEASRG